MALSGHGVHICCAEETAPFQTKVQYWALKIISRPSLLLSTLHLIHAIYGMAPPAVRRLAGLAWLGRVDIFFSAGSVSIGISSTTEGGESQSCISTEGNAHQPQQQS